MAEQTTQIAAGAVERDVIAVVGQLVRELHPQRARFIDIAPSSRIERDLGIDSLGRTETKVPFTVENLTELPT